MSFFRIVWFWSALQAVILSWFFRYLLFHLQQQKLIELIREQKVDEAIDFAQNHLAERGEEDPKVREATRLFVWRRDLKG